MWVGDAEPRTPLQFVLWKPGAAGSAVAYLGTEPVAYTHLDVYKRQVRGRGARGNLSLNHGLIREMSRVRSLSRGTVCPCRHCARRV